MGQVGPLRRRSYASILRQRVSRSSPRSIASCSSSRSLAAAPTVSLSIGFRGGQAQSACQDVEILVDGVWGGIVGAPSVRLKVLSNGGASTEFKYYSVAVDPILGIASVEYELTSGLYYWNL